MSVDGAAGATLVSIYVELRHFLSSRDVIIIDIILSNGSTETGSPADWKASGG